MLTIVTGTGRSGTTLFMRALEHAGVTMAPMDEGFCESHEAIAVNTTILKARGIHAWRETEELARECCAAIQSIAGPVIKQTEICHTLDVWRAARDDLNVIVCRRRLDDVRRSFLAAYKEFRGDLAYQVVPEVAGEVPVEAWPAFSYGQLMDILQATKISHCYFDFPRDVDTPDCAWDNVSAVLEPLVKRAAFVDALKQVSDLSKIHWSATKK